MDTFASFRTRYYGPTNTKGSKIIATDDWPREWVLGERSLRRKFVDYDHALNSTENHEMAARKWLDEYIPEARLASPGLAFDGDYYWTWQGRE